MNARSFKQNLIEMQQGLLRLACKLSINHKVSGNMRQQLPLKTQGNGNMSRPETMFKNWGDVIMYNFFVADYREIVKEQSIEDAEKIYHLAPTEEYASKTMNANYADLKAMHRLVNFLPRAYKIPFKMYVSGFSYQEIADKLNLPIETLKKRICFVQLHLKSLLEWLG